MSSPLFIRPELPIPTLDELDHFAKTKLQLCQAKIGYKFKDQMICLEALNASAWIPRNDRLAIYGDKIIESHLIRTIWYDTGKAKGKAQVTSH